MITIPELATVSNPHGVFPAVTCADLTIPHLESTRCVKPVVS